MKAALVSATSLAALLAFEVGLDVAIDAHPAKAQQFSVSPASLSFGYVLLNSTVGNTVLTLTESVISDTNTKLTLTIPQVAASSFTGASLSTVLINKSGTTLTNNYTFAPTTIGAYGTPVTVTGTITSGVSAGKQTAVVTLTGQGVAPEQQTTLGTTSAGAVRIGTTATIAAITVANIGNGDLYSSSIAAAQLQVSLGTPSNSVFTAPATTSFTLNDSHYTPTLSGVSVTAADYLYAPTTHTVGQTASATLNFLNGGSNTNTTTASVVTLTGTGIGPVFKGVYSGTTYTNNTAIGTSVNNAGNVSLGTQKHGTTVPFTITVSNASTDTPSGSLTNLTLNGFSLGTCVVTGCTSDGFSVISFTTGGITEGNSVAITLDFSGGVQTYYDADLLIDTDQGAAGGLGQTGATFSYLLTANIPEPATIVTFGMGLAGLGWARRRRAARRSAIGTDASPA
jgi:hypothetical protein